MILLFSQVLSSRVQSTMNVPQHILHSVHFCLWLCSVASFGPSKACIHCSSFLHCFCHSPSQPSHWDLSYSEAGSSAIQMFTLASFPPEFGFSFFSHSAFSCWNSKRVKSASLDLGGGWKKTRAETKKIKIVSEFILLYLFFCVKRLQVFCKYKLLNWWIWGDEMRAPKRL